MPLHVLFTEDGIPGWIGADPREGSEEVDKELTFLAEYRRTAKGSWVRRTALPPYVPSAEESLALAEAEREAALRNRDEALRKALTEEADPLFFKWQAGEVAEADWREMRRAVKERFPKP
jgi:hypothetical protein